MTNEQLDQLQQQSDRATPGPWELWTSNSNRRISGPNGVDGGVLYGITPKDGTSDLVGEPADLDLIPAARNALPDLIATIRELLWKRDALIEAVTYILSDDHWKDDDAAGHLATTLDITIDKAWELLKDATTRHPYIPIIGTKSG